MNKPNTANMLWRRFLKSLALSRSAVFSLQICSVSVPYYYTVYSDRIPEIRHIQSGILNVMAATLEESDINRGFSSNVAHYRVLMNVK